MRIQLFCLFCVRFGKSVVTGLLTNSKGVLSISLSHSERPKYCDIHYSTPDYFTVDMDENKYHETK